MVIKCSEPKGKVEIKCVECGGAIIEIPFVNEEGKKETLYAHSETSTQCDLKKDGIDVKIIDRRLNNIFNEMIKETIKESNLSQKEEEKVSKPLKANESPLDRGKTLKDRLCEGLISITEFDLILERLKKEIK